MGNRPRSAIFERYGKKISHKKDKDFFRLAKCLVAAKDEMNMNLFWDDQEERFIRKYIEFVEETSDDDKTFSS